MKRLTRVLRSRWLWSGIGALLIAVLVWLFGPLLAALESLWPRLAIMLALALVWAGGNLLLDQRARRRDATLAAGVAPDASAMAEEASELQGKLRQALDLLRRASGTRGYLYEQPWYVIIGPPGAGKTTALLNAGLQFPLADALGSPTVGGAGGTRLCDWWFTDQAVLIDTAGRYTTQDSDATVDRAGWEAFLDLLRRARPRQPLNGVIVALAIPDLMGDEAVARDHARAVRTRIRELNQRLGVRLPVYALFTKADRLAGFTEFFEDLNRDRREQVWGMTFPLPAKGAVEMPAQAFGTEWKLLVQRLDERLLSRLQAERSPERRALCVGFPVQVASLAEPLGRFLADAFGGSRLDPAPLLRGAYLTSGTQEGTPLDRLAGTLARSFGVDRARLASLRPQAGRSYFLGRLLRDVIFGEAMLVAANPERRRRGRMIYAGAAAACVLGAFGGSGLLLAAAGQGAAEADRASTALAAYERDAGAAHLDSVANGDLSVVAPLLDQARALPFGPDDPAKAGLMPGLDQTAKLRTGAAAVYRRALERILLPRLLWQLEAQMRAAIARPRELYEATHAYLMLVGAGPLRPAALREWMQGNWLRTYPGATSAPLRDALARHFDALQSGPLPAVESDAALVADTRRALSRVSLADRVYATAQSAAPRQPNWVPAEALGPGSTSLFTRTSGLPLTDGIPGWLTPAGLHRGLLPTLPSALRTAAQDSWVLGAGGEAVLDQTGLLHLEGEVMRIYEADYVRTWDAMLADLQLQPPRTGDQARHDLYLLGSPQSPLRDLLVSITRQLRPSEPPPPPAANAAVHAGSAAPQPTEAPGRAIDLHYRALQAVLGDGKGPAPLDTILRLIADLQSQLIRATTPGAAPAPLAEADAAASLRAEAERQPEPLHRWLVSLGQTGSALRGGGLRQQAMASLNASSGPGPMCRQIAARFPFNPASSADAPLEDFAQLFGAGGRWDQWFNGVRPFVDTSGATWRPQGQDGTAPPLSAADVAALQQAQRVRDMLFAGGARPQAVFDLMPVAADPGTKQATLDLDGTVISYAQGAARSTRLMWPGPTGMANARLTFDPPSTTGPSSIEAHGAWALFRLLQQARVTQAGPGEVYRVAFQLGDRSVTYELRAASAQNPFAPGTAGLGALRRLTCPAL